MQPVIFFTELPPLVQSFLFYSSIGVVLLSLFLLAMLARARAIAKRSSQVLKLRTQEIEQQHLEIREQKQALEDLHKVKDKVFSIIAHDFRSPLNTIQGVLSLLHIDALSEEELRMLLPDLTRKVDASINLLDNILHWSRAQMRGIQTNPADFRLRKVITETISHMHQLATQKDILIQVFVDESIKVHADLEMIRLVIRNLLSNAIKFSYESHAVHVEVTRDTSASSDGYAVVSIIDFGVGIPSSILPVLFDRNGYTTKGTAQEKGTGLGLNLCQECVERNGGTIWVDSQPEVKTTFSFTVPLATIDQPIEVC